MVCIVFYLNHAIKQLLHNKELQLAVHVLASVEQG
jgi:hypothetical protein